MREARPSTRAVGPGPCAVCPYDGRHPVWRNRRVSPARPAAPRCTLASLPSGDALRVDAVDAAHADELGREGLLPGAVIRVAARTPLGGPVIVMLGRSRLALSLDVARAVHGERVG